MASANIEKTASIETLGENVEHPFSNLSQELNQDQNADTPTFRHTDNLPNY
jgi:hypothetical protein